MDGRINGWMDGGRDRSLYMVALIMDVSGWSHGWMITDKRLMDVNMYRGCGRVAARWQPENH